MHLNALLREATDCSHLNFGSTPLNPLILIVEDDPAIRDSLKLLLETRGYDVETFATGAELLEGCKFKQCNCFILDVNLPGDNGFEVLEKMRNLGSRTPVIFMSGRASAETRYRAQQANAAAFFDKPVPPRELLAAITAATGNMP
ncbi:MAG: response regulator [Alphaproteobacteria bacterium]|nr:response regulator [Alphaproteobacteria bacterium]